VNGQPLHWLRSTDPPDAFPPAETAWQEPNGLLAAGGDLSPERLIAAYRRGIFPWFSEGQPILWWCPDPRAVFLPGKLHISRSLGRRLRSAEYQVSVDQDFGSLIRLCAKTRQDSGTWITRDMIRAYTRLHERGVAHSIEVWHGASLAGGLYGIAIGGAFFGESMVSLLSDASKVALVCLDAVARQHGISLIDCQVPNPHLDSLGATRLPRAEFLRTIGSLVSAGPERRIRPTPLRATSELG